MTDFTKRLERAIARGFQTRDEKGREAGEREADVAKLREKHGALRIALSEHIESGLRQMADHFPGFDYSTVVGDDGWGARIARDDLNLSGQGERNRYSRLEMLIRPFSDAHIVELATKGTIRNRETLNRSHFRFLAEATDEGFREIIDALLLEFAEQYAAEG